MNETVPPPTKTPPPQSAVFPEMEQDETVTVPDWMLMPPPHPPVYPLVMLNPISCTTSDELGLMYSTRRGLEEFICASSTTEPATAASRTTLLVMLSSAMRL